MTNINRKRNFSSLVNQAGKKLFTTTAITAVGLLSITGNAQAQDTGPWDLEVTGGNFTKDFSKPNTNTITQLTDRAIGTGDANIDLNETVIVHQKNSNSLFVARDNKADPTAILGNLKANGRVMVVDQNGIFFGTNSNVNVGSIVATTGQVTDQDIMDGDDKLTISHPSRRPEETRSSINVRSAQIVNDGSITVAEAGVAAFVSPNVLNNGVIKAKMGKVVMAAAETVTLDFHGDGLVEVAVKGELADGLLENRGHIEASGGEVLVTASIAKNAVDNVINMDGIVDASSATVKGGKIVLSGGSKGTVKVSGKLKADGGKAGAGDIDVSGQNIFVTKTAEATANSAEGAAGIVDVIADDTLLIDGLFSAQGLAGTGEIETSAPNTNFGAGASILATREWLLDPTDVIIDVPLAALIEAQLGLGNMTVQTPAAGGDAGNIEVNTVVDWSTANVFSLIAHNDINFNNGGGINSMTTGNFTADAGGSIRLKAGNANVKTHQGDITLTSGDEFTLADGMIISNNGNVLIDNGQSFEALANSILVGTGTVEVNQNKDSDGLFTIANPTIQNAIDAIHNLGDGTSTVNVGAGTWVESVVADVRNLILNGANAGINPNAFVPRVPETIITPVASEGIYVNENNVAIDGFTIDGAGVVGANGIHAKSVEDFRAVNNIIKNNMDTVAGRQTSQYTTGNGIFIEDATGELFVAGNHLHDNEDGIQVLNSNVSTDKDSLITHNVSENNKDNGIVVKNSDNLIIQTNIVDDNKNGIWIDWSDNTYVGHNIIRDTTEDAIRLSNQTDNTFVEVNTIERAGLHGIHTYVTGSHIIKHNVISDVTHDGIRIEKGTGHDVSFNTISDAGDDGIDVANVDMINLNYNDITDVDGNGISLQQTKDLKVTNNDITNAGKNGIVATDTTGVTDIYFNDIDQAGEDGIRVVGSVNPYIHTNTVGNTGGVGIHVDNFEKSWISYNDIFLTGGHGVSATNGGFVSIYDNYIELSGYQSNAPAFGNTQVNSNADGIYVENIYGTNIPPVNLAASGPGSSTYGSNVEVYGNDVAIATDDGIQIRGTNSAYIANNIIGHTDDDGIDVNDAGVVIARDNGVTTVGDKGITIDGGQYAGVFDNRIALTGNDGIQVENVHGSQNAMVFGDVEYGYGWSVNVSGNEIAMTGDDSIEVGYSGATRIQDNEIFMAGMGYELGNTIDTINQLASSTSLTMPAFARAIAPPPANEFTWQWGNGHGINVHGIEGAYYSPNGWAADINGNDVKYTGGHGISARDSDRTRIQDNDVRYAGLDQTTFVGQRSMLSTLNAGPFDRSNPGRRDLWAADESMIDVFENYFGVEEPTEDIYVTLNNIVYDNHDGIHAENTFNRYQEGLSEADYLFALKITDNVVKHTGDDGIEVRDAGRTLIANNNIRDAGYGDAQDYGSGDYDGADGIRVTNVTAPLGGVTVLRASGVTEEPPVEEEGYSYEADENYALIIRNNDIERTADDGIEVVGGENIMMPQTTLTKIVTEEPVEKNDRYYGSTDRVLIAENTVRETGYFDNESDIEEPGLKNGYENVGPDGYGHDGIHVRNINGQSFDGPVWDVAAAGNAGNAGENSYGFYGYAVDIINNDVRKTGDDGIEVFNSDSTLILGNTVHESGVYWGTNSNEKLASKSDAIHYNTDGADYYGADGIHVRNVGGNTEPTMYPVVMATTAGSGEGGNGYIDPYAVAIVDNHVQKTADDGIEVVGENQEYDNGWNNGLNIVSANSQEATYQYNGTGRTLILQNTIRHAGVSGHYGHSDSSSYDSRTGYGPSEYSHFGNQGSYDGYGGDGIHVRGVGNVNEGSVWWPTADAVKVGSSAGDSMNSYDGNYAVKIIENDINRTGDDGIEVVGNNFDNIMLSASLAGAGPAPYPSEIGRVLIENNTVEDSGISGGSRNSTNYSNNGYDEGGSYYNHGNSHESDYYGNAGDDGYGADGIHVRGIGGNNDGWTMASAAGNAGNAGNGYGYYNYAVDILGNSVKHIGDDGIEVRDSSSTLISRNDVETAGLLSSGSYSNSYSSSSADDYSSSTSTNHSSWHGGNNQKGSYTGGDGIHVENVGQNIFAVERSTGGVKTGDGFVDYAVVINNNTVDQSADDGIEALYSGRTRIETNTLTNSGLASHQGSGGYSSTNVNSPYSSIYSDWENGSYEGSEGHDSRGSDGIHVGGVYANEYSDYPVESRLVGLSTGGSTENSVEIVGNTVDNSADDGIQVVDSGTTLIEANTISNSGIGTSYGDEGGSITTVAAAIQIIDEENITFDSDTYEYGGTGSKDYTGGDGINVSRDRLDEKPSPKPKPDIFEVNEVISEEPEETRFDVKIIANTVTDSNDDGIEVIGSMYRETNVLVDINDVTNSGDNGIALLSGAPFFDEKREEISPSVSLISVGAPMNSLTTGNTVVNSGNNSLFVGGPSHDQVTVSGNTFTDFDIGAHFESGRIDLTGEGNDLNGGRIGLRFAPAEVMPYYDDYKVSLSEPTFADMSLVDDTIGAQRFDGQSSFFVELDNGAFFDPGTPTFLRENDSTFVGTPFGTFTPATDYADGYPVAVLDYLESKFQHYNDDGTLGLFFLEPLDEIDQENVFNTFAPLSDGLGGLNVTLLGLPSIPGAPTALNNIAPAAGGTPTPANLNDIETAAGDDETDPDALNEIKTAAGGEQTSCWGDALNTAEGGQATTLSYTGSTEDLLNGEANCNNATIN